MTARTAGDNLKDALAESMRRNGDPIKKKGSMNQQQVTNALFAVLIAGGGWWMNNIWGAVQSQQQQITQLSVELARNYAPRVELQGRFDKIDQQLDHILQNQKDRR